jgi:hypothetical protein
MFGMNKRLQLQYDSLLVAYNQLKNQNVALYEENERRRQWNIKQDEEVHNLRMSVYRLQEIIKELELDKHIDSEVKTLVLKKKRGRLRKEKTIQKEVKEEKPMKGYFAREYWAWKRTDPNNKLSMKEYATQFYNKKNEVVSPVEEKKE